MNIPINPEHIEAAAQAEFNEAQEIIHNLIKEEPNRLSDAQHKALLTFIMVMQGNELLIEAYKVYTDKLSTITENALKLLDETNPTDDTKSPPTEPV